MLIRIFIEVWFKLRIKTEYPEQLQSRKNCSPCAEVRKNTFHGKRHVEMFYRFICSIGSCTPGRKRFTNATLWFTSNKVWIIHTVFRSRRISSSLIGYFLSALFSSLVKLPDRNENSSRYKNRHWFLTFPPLSRPNFPLDSTKSATEFLVQSTKRFSFSSARTELSWRKRRPFKDYNDSLIIANRIDRT